MEQIKVIKTKASEFADSIEKDYNERHKAWTTLTKLCLSSSMYPLPVLILIEKIHTHHMAPYTSSPSKIREYSRFHNDILYRNPYLQGIGLASIFKVKLCAYLRNSETYMEINNKRMLRWMKFGFFTI